MEFTQEQAQAMAAKLAQQEAEIERLNKLLKRNKAHPIEVPNDELPEHLRQKSKSRWPLCTNRDEIFEALRTYPSCLTTLAVMLRLSGGKLEPGDENIRLRIWRQPGGDRMEPADKESRELLLRRPVPVDQSITGPIELAEPAASFVVCGKSHVPDGICGLPAGHSGPCQANPTKGHMLLLIRMDRARESVSHAARFQGSMIVTAVEPGHWTVCKSIRTTDHDNQIDDQGLVQLIHKNMAPA